MSIKPETHKRLKDFIERAEKIRRFSYFDGKERIAGFEINKINDNWQVDFYQPNDEQRDALVLNLRLFLQDKDGISIRKLSEVSSDPGLSVEWKTEFESYRNRLNFRLDNIALERNQENITYRDILKMFLFGKIAHDRSDDEANKLYQKWVVGKTDYEVLHNLFHRVLIWTSTAILNISSVNQEELQRHEIR